MIELSEGDLVLTFNKTIDLMRQVAEMLADVKPEHPLRRTLQQAESLLRRDIVEQSLILGFAPIALPEIARSQLELAKAENRQRRHLQLPLNQSEEVEPDHELEAATGIETKAGSRQLL